MRRGDIASKFEVNYWLPAYRLNAKRIESSKWPVLDLVELTVGRPGGLKDGPGGWLVSRSEYVEAGIPVIRATNVSEEGLDLSSAVFITEQKHRELGATQVLPGDLLLTMRGTIGRSAIVPDSVSAANLNAAVCRIRLRDTRSNPYLCDFLNSGVGRKQTMRQGHKAVQGDVTLGAIADLRIPLPPLDKQRVLTATMESARETRHAKVLDADALLTGLDAYLLDMLGLVVPPADDRRAFAMTAGNLSAQSRLGPDYFHPERVLMIRAIQEAFKRMPCTKLSAAVSFVRVQIKTPGPNYLGLSGVQSQTGELSGVIGEVEGACFEFRTGDVLFARLRPYLNKVWCADKDGCCSPEFHVLRIRDTRELNPEFLAAALRSNLVLAQTRHMMTGNTHPRLANDDVAELVVPVPDLVVQETIAAEVRRRRERARTLRAKAEAGWLEAKQWFEEQLLGPEPGLPAAE